MKLDTASYAALDKCDALEYRGYCLKGSCVQQNAQEGDLLNVKLPFPPPSCSQRREVCCTS
jgi:hypothetical protein